MIQNTQSKNKNSFNQVNSNNITINNLQIPKGCLAKSQIYDLLNIFNNSQIKAADSPKFMSTNPAYMPIKLQFNNAQKYALLFKEYASFFNKFNEVLDQFVNSEKIIRKVRTIYLNVAVYTEAGIVVGNGDEQLDKINDEIKALIKNDPRYDHNIYSETIDIMVYCLMARCVELCKILINPNEVKQK
ncbi:hypothetical protein [Lactobacillus johnsonii]|uniref:hypothetical protein n=1 Tax=Lactobacillus johnsonii TaxID=33959 RepID=UPI00107E6C69|nr:hypothetical protein [Lactobacillus johnsonii]TGA93948.1 hypothetical protein E5F86_04075 [Lactobacillus johnsonii]